MSFAISVSINLRYDYAAVPTKYQGRGLSKTIEMELIQPRVCETLECIATEKAERSACPSMSAVRRAQEKPGGRLRTLS